MKKDREMAKALAAELNEVYQQSLETKIAQKKATTLKKPVMIKMAAKKRQPLKTYLGAQERKKMITFLKGAVGVKKEMFSKMSFEQIKGLYDAEMTKLQENDKARVEMEKRMKESNDFLIEKPFPDDQETPKKEATLCESFKTLKRTKMMARRKLVKKPRVAEEVAEQKVAEEEGAPKSEEKEAQSQEEPSSTYDVNMYVVVMEKVPEPITAEPVGVKPPQIIHWDTMEVDGKEYIRQKRKDEKFEVYPTWAKIVRVCSRSDLEEMFEVGMKLYADKLKPPEIPVTKLVMEYLCMLFKPEEVQHVIRNIFKTINNWTLLKLHVMLKKKLGCAPNSEMASQDMRISRLEDNHGRLKITME
ncbi:hypothetical protein L6452_01857 [Arctium lappa]|uniref:Uncharacterized protein n=1 Tax=Arctium lappa TaxID=4217 RepID=A0ACB9FHV1_ARCLA|nr:hypothetical protein L6452_01857 [Arctium lappa]